MKELEKYKERKEYVQVKKTLKLINILIDNSEKRTCLGIESLITKEKSDNISIVIINDIVYVN